MLAEFYTKAKSVDPNGLEIIFVSADSDQSSFDVYFGEMPWTATVYGHECNDGMS